MFDTALRARVVRLLANDFRIEDLTTLYLALREMSGGRETVTEIGNFVAHRGERTRGITTRSLRDFFTVVRFTYPVLIGMASNKYDTADMPRNMREYLPAALRRVDAIRLKKETGLKKITAEKTFAGILARIVEHSDGRLELSRPTSDDLALLKNLTGHFTLSPAFTGERIYKELQDALIESGLLKHKELRMFRPFESTIILYAISIMHGSIIDLGDGTKAALFATADAGRGTMGIWAIADLDPKQSIVRIVPRVTVGRDEIGGPAIETDLKADECCEPALRLSPLVISRKLETSGLANKAPYWDFLLELNAANRKLTKLG